MGLVLTHNVGVRILLCFPFMFLDSRHVLFPVCLCCHVLVVFVLSGHVFPVFVLRLRPHLPYATSWFLPSPVPNLYPVCFPDWYLLCLVNSPCLVPSLLFKFSLSFVPCWFVVLAW